MKAATRTAPPEQRPITTPLFVWGGAADGICAVGVAVHGPVKAMTVEKGEPAGVGALVRVEGRASFVLDVGAVGRGVFGGDAGDGAFATVSGEASWGATCRGAREDCGASDGACRVCWGMCGLSS